MTPEQVQELTAQLRRDDPLVEEHRKNVEGLAELFRQLYAKESVERLISQAVVQHDEQSYANKSVEGELRERNGIRWLVRKALRFWGRSAEPSESALFDQAYVDRLKATWGTVDHANILVHWCEQHTPKETRPDPTHPKRRS